MLDTKSHKQKKTKLTSPTTHCSNSRLSFPRITSTKDRHETNPDDQQPVNKLTGYSIFARTGTYIQGSLKIQPCLLVASNAAHRRSLSIHM